MRVESQDKLPVYQVVGKTLRIHWDYKEIPATEDRGAGWSMQEAVVSVLASRSCIIEAVMACTYPTPGAEFAALCNGGEDAKQHEAARAAAKELADGWLINAAQPLI
jgi:hypothetical protein